MLMHDSLGNPISVTEPASLGAVDDFIEGFISCEARAANVLAASQDPSPIVQAYCATLHLFAESRDAASGAPLRTLQGHMSLITSVAFSPRGDTLASTSADGTTRLWDTDVERKVAHKSDEFDILASGPDSVRRIASRRRKVST